MMLRESNKKPLENRIEKRSPNYDKNCNQNCYDFEYYNS